MLFKEKRTDFVCLLEANGVFMGKRLFLSAFLFFSLFSIHAVSLTFQIIQHCSSLKDVCESSLRMEDEIMNAFFEAGYIVSNIPAVPSESEADDDKIFKAGINEAAESSFDNFLALHIYFDKQAISNGEDPELGSIYAISWKMGEVKSGRIIDDGRRSIKKTVARDSESNMRKSAQEFVLHIQKILRANT